MNLMSDPRVKRFSLTDLRSARESGAKIPVLTAYDYCSAKLMSQAGVRVLLVGDSAANVILGHETTLPVSLDFMAELTGAVLKDLSLQRGQEVILLVNGFGGTPLLELYLMVNAAHKVLAGAGVKAVRHLTGSYVTSLEMAGCSITVSVADAPTLALWDAPLHTAALRWGM